MPGNGGQGETGGKTAGRCSCACNVGVCAGVHRLQLDGVQAPGRLAVQVMQLMCSTAQFVAFESQIFTHRSSAITACSPLHSHSVWLPHTLTRLPVRPCLPAAPADMRSRSLLGTLGSWRRRRALRLGLMGRRLVLPGWSEVAVLLPGLPPTWMGR